MLKNLLKREYNVAERLKTFLIALAAFVIVAAVLAGILQFNYGGNYRSGVEYAVSFADDLSDKALYNKYADDVTDILEGLTDKDGNSLGIKVYTAKRVENDQKYSIIFKTNDIGKTQVELADLSDEYSVLSQFNVKLTEYEQANDTVAIPRIKSYTAKEDFWRNFAIALILMALTAALSGAYAFLRFGTAKGVAVFLTLFADAAVFFAFMAITRLPFTGMFIAIMSLIMMFSSLNMFRFFARLGENGQRTQNKGIGYPALINRTFSDALPVSLLVMGVCAAATVAMCAGGLDILFFAAPIAAGLLTSFFTSLMLMPSMLAALTKRLGN